MSTKLEKFMLSISEVYWIVFLSLQRMQKKLKKKLFECQCRIIIDLRRKNYQFIKIFSRELLYVCFFMYLNWMVYC